MLRHLLDFITFVRSNISSTCGTALYCLSLSISFVGMLNLKFISRNLIKKLLGKGFYVHILFHTYSFICSIRVITKKSLLLLMMATFSKWRQYKYCNNILIVRQRARRYLFPCIKLHYNHIIAI